MMDRVMTPAFRASIAQNCDFCRMPMGIAGIREALNAAIFSWTLDGMFGGVQ
jgi:hypothetical protein